MTSIPTYKKPKEYLALPDWYANAWELRQTAETRITDSYNLRAEARQLCNETDIQTKWDTLHNNIRLSDRIGEISLWYEVLEQCLSAVRGEIEKLSKAKFKTERDLESLGLQLGTISECLRQRDCRQDDDLILLDEAEAELKNELAVVEALKNTLTERCYTTWQQLNRLREIEHQLQTDLENKKLSLDIDSECLEMNKDSTGIRFKPDPLRIPKKSVHLDTWMELSRYNKMKADNQIATSAKLREALYNIQEQTKNDILAQQKVTNYALRHRIFEIERQKFELDWQRQKMSNEMAKLALEIEALEKALLEKTNSIKLAETRLENRKFRRGTELVQDEPQIGLAGEVLQLCQTKNDLLNKIDDAKATYNALERHIMRLDRDISNKHNAVVADKRCLEIRNQVTVSGSISKTQMNRNLQLARVDESI